jgi:HD-like signal output (HDOD) protein
MQARREFPVQLKTREKLLQLIRDKRTQIPTLPVVVHNILKLVENERTSSGDLCSFIGKDQGIANRVLRLANSAYYGQARGIDNLPRAVMVIGFSEVVSLSIGMSVFSTFQQVGAGGLLGMSDLWLHSMGCYFASKRINALLGAKPSRERAAGSSKSSETPVYLSALLHDMGKVILAMHFPDEYAAVLLSARQTGSALELKEKEMLGIDHAAVAYFLLDRWQFPQALMISVRYHHAPENADREAKRDARVVSLADTLTHMAMIGNSGNPRIPFAGTSAMSLGLSDRDLAVLTEGLKTDLPEIQRFLELMR